MDISKNQSTIQLPPLPTSPQSSISSSNNSSHHLTYQNSSVSLNDNNTTDKTKSTTKNKETHSELSNEEIVNYSSVYNDYCQRKKRIDSNLDNLQSTIELLHQDSKKMEEEIVLQKILRQKRIQCEVQNQDNILLSIETDYLEKRLAIIEKRQQLELSLLEKKFQWEYGVKKLQQKYQINANKLSVDSSCQTVVNTYNKQIDVSNPLVSWDHPPFNPVEPSYNSTNSFSSFLNQTEKVSEQPQIHNNAVLEQTTQQSAPTTKPQQTPPTPPPPPPLPPRPSIKLPPRSNAPLQSSPVPLPSHSDAIENPSSQTPKNSPKNQQMERRHTLNSVTLEEQLREALQSKFKNVVGSDNDSSQSEQSEQSEEDF